MTRAVIYTRKSVSKGLEQPFNSLDAQRDACEVYARQQGWTISEERYDDGGYTGANMERPALGRLLEAVERGEVDAVVVYKVDRIGRSLVDFAKLIERFKEAEVAFVSVTQNFCTTDAIGKFTLNILMSFAELEREMIGERTRDKIASARKRGYWTGGAIPFGYQREDKKLRLVPSEAQWVRDIFTQFQSGRSIMDITRALSQKSKSREKTATRGRARWSRDAVRRILKNPIYAGYLAYKSELYKGEHEAIVDKAVFDEVQAQLIARRPMLGLHRGDNLFVGTIHCQCGRAMTINSTRKGGSRYRYYRCIRKSKEGREGCSSPQVPAELVEQFVLSKLQTLIAEGYLSKDVTERMAQRNEEEKTRLETQRQFLTQQNTVLLSKIRKTVDELLIHGEKVKPHLEAKIEALELEQVQCETDLQMVEQSLSAVEAIKIDVNWVTQCLSRFDTVWQAMTLPHRRGVIQLLVEHVRVDSLNNYIEVKFCDIESSPKAA